MLKYKYMHLFPLFSALFNSAQKAKMLLLLVFVCSAQITCNHSNLDGKGFWHICRRVKAVDLSAALSHRLRCDSIVKQQKHRRLLQIRPVDRG